MKASKNRVLNKSGNGQVTSRFNNNNNSNQGSGKQQNSYKKSERSELDSQLRTETERIEGIFGYERLKSGTPRIGWLLNYVQVTLPDDEIANAERSALDLYFIDNSGRNFKATIFSKPYFYIDLDDPKRNLELMNYLQKRFDGCTAEELEKEDLDMPNHLSGKKHKFIKLSFKSVSQLSEAKANIRPFVAENKKTKPSDDLFFSNQQSAGVSKDKNTKQVVDPLQHVTDMREHDLTYSMRVAIDKDIRIGSWYSVSIIPGTAECSAVRQREMLELCQPRILAFDIECEKAALKFPNADHDRIYMISYMVAGQGYLITNREIVSADVSDFEYTPKPQYPGPFVVMNEANEENLLRKFISHIQELRPHVIVTYNGDFFDWPYVDKRCKKYNISLKLELGISGGTGDITGEDEYTGKCIVHLDAFAWVKRDSYLPQGTQGLKSVTKHKLGYDPVEVDPEDMTRLAVEQPHHMAAYSVSDAVATYYLYTVYVHNFIFSMSTIIPLNSEDVLRKGSGTLCEALLMVEACTKNIICPNKQADPLETYHEGRLLESETYIGGHVECLEAGVFRADIPAEFHLVPSALQGLIDHIDRDLTFALEVEHGLERSDVLDYDSVKLAIVERLEMLRDAPNRQEKPFIYHLDVGAMYPNIILTNRLQPGSLVSLSDCAGCDFNRKENNCKRNMKWIWRGEYSPANTNEYLSIKNQLANERFNGKMFSDLPEKEQVEIAKKRLKDYSQKVYRKSKITQTETREDTVCMRENPFYVNTVRDFRNRRYEYKLETKTWKGKKVDAEKRGDAVARKVAEDKEVLMDSLQLAHKCILNSFYGYVMRKGARWRSMEMAGIVTYTGALLIKQARELVEQIGRPLELDTDGIWCILPASFPQDFKLRYRKTTYDASGAATEKIETIKISYPCAMLNADVHASYTNDQYQDLVESSGATKKFSSHSECSIFFELDGPYKAMILPASPEEGKLLKKKYVVFNFDGSLAELKGFELKRRGELEIVKQFQEDVFDKFLNGDSLKSCYEAVGAVANYWLDVLDTQGANINDDELMHYISEKKTISKTLEDYEGRKATSLTTAGRIAEFLGAEMVKDKGLNCNLIISRLPANAPVTDRAIPVAIFSAEHSIRNYYLRKWLKDPYLDCSDFRDVVDWDYYKMRLGRTIQKIITIPAGMQFVDNPCPRVQHPPWLQHSLDEKKSGKRQVTITSLFGPKLLGAKTSASHRDTSAAASSSTQEAGPLKRALVGDVEDMVSPLRASSGGRPVIHTKAALKPTAQPFTPTEPAAVAEDPSISPAVTLIPILPPVNAEQPVAAGTEVADLGAWLEHRKASWRKKRADTRQGRIAQAKGKAGFPMSLQNAENADPNAKKKPMGVADLVQNASMMAAFGVWQIIELQETDTPGEFFVWVMTGKTQMQKLSLIVPRVIYVNYKLGSAEEAVIQQGGKKVKRFLPHEKPCLNLFELSFSEKKFIRNEKEKSAFLSDPAIEGVYEAQVPLWFRAVCRLGCVARVSKASATAGAKSFQLKDLEFINTHGQPYLSSTSAAFRKIYIYHTVDRSRPSGLGIVAMFVLDGNNENDQSQTAEGGAIHQTARAYVWFANGSGSQESKPPLQRIYRRHEQDERAEVKFVSVVTATVPDALGLCNERLSAYLRERKGPTLVVVQGACGTEPRSWRKALPLLQEFPLITMPPNSTDDKYPAPIYWQNFVAERMVQRYKVFPEWLSDRLESARFSHIPVAHLGSDALTTMTDVQLARKLEASRHLLWATERQLPDLGGSEQDCYNVWSDPLREPTVNCPGAYRMISMEIELFGVAICAIMSSTMLDMIGMGITDNDTDKRGGGVDLLGEDIAPPRVMLGDTNASSDASCARAFNTLKAMVAEWFHAVEMGSAGSAYADGSLINLYRYLCGFGGESMMNDPALHRIIYGLMSKLFRRLINELKLLGVEIVFANFEKIIIHTKKRTADAAAEYLDFIVATVKAKEVFRYLQMNTKRVWEQLLWLERENWGGIELREDSGEMPGVDGLALTGGTEGDDDLVHAHEMQEDDGNAAAVVAGEEGVHVEADPNAMDEDETFEAHLPKKNLNNKSTKKKVGFTDGVGEGDEGAAMTEDNYESMQYSKRQREKLKKDKLAFLSDDFDDDGEESDDEESEGAAEAEGEAAEGAQELGDEGQLPAADEAIYGEWNLVTYLPPAAAQYFHFFVNEFMRQHHKKWRELVHLREAASTEEAAYTGDYDDLLCDDDTLLFKVLDFMKGLVSGKITKKLLEVIDELTLVYGNGRESEKHFPVRAGSYLHLKNPALEFAKAVTHIMALDANLEAEVSALRRNLLTKLEIREFNSISEYRDPSLSYVLRDVICSFCTTCRDIDMLRDQGVAMSATGVSASTTEKRSWDLVCPNCSSLVDQESIEYRLLGEVHKASAAYLLQDLRCPQTHQVSIRYCAAHSKLSQPLQMDIPPADFKQQMFILLKVAEFHHFEMLEMTVRDMVPL